jgi:predicted Zn-dependent protease with MMP-like domain
MMTIDEMQDVRDELAEELPEVFFKELNGGIVLLPEAKESEYSQKSDLYTLGEYHHGGAMGNYIKIYYGSFERLFSYLTEEQMKAQLRKTLRHEFRHHIETLAGEDDLVDEDTKFIRSYLERGLPVRGRKKRQLPFLRKKPSP